MLQVLQALLLQLEWCTQGGGELYALTPQEHNWCTQEGLQEVVTMNVVEQPTTSVYQKPHSTIQPIQLGLNPFEDFCMEPNTKQVMEEILVHCSVWVITMFPVQCASLQTEQQCSWFQHGSVAHLDGHWSTMAT